MFVKKCHNNTELIKFDFLKMNNKATTDSHAPLREEPRGIPPEKKSDMITKLLPLIPTTRHAFWNILKTTENAIDLITSDK